MKLIGTTAATASVHTPTTNVVQFRPRPSALVHTEIARRGLPGDSALWRHLREWAQHACIATEGDKRTWKVEPGEVYSREHPQGVADRLGISRGRVWNVLVQLRTEGLIATRRCSPKRMAVVFLFGDPPRQGSREESGEGSREDSSVPRQVPRSDPRTEGGQPRVRVRDEPRYRCTTPGCGNDWPESFGPKCFECRGYGELPKPAADPVQGQIDFAGQCAYNGAGYGKRCTNPASDDDSVFCDYHAADGKRCHQCQKVTDCRCCFACGATRRMDCRCGS